MRGGHFLETACGVGEFRCRDGTCIGNSSRCNQFVDCDDASDEMNCSEWCPLPGPPWLLRCCSPILPGFPPGPQGGLSPLAACLSRSCSLLPGLSPLGFREGQ